MFPAFARRNFNRPSSLFTHERNKRVKNGRIIGRRVIIIAVEYRSVRKSSWLRWIFSLLRPCTIEETKRYYIPHVFFLRNKIVVGVLKGGENILFAVRNFQAEASDVDTLRRIQNNNKDTSRAFST